jgi:hypothetical protein
MLPGKKFDPATETSRRPTPETFAHLRRWVTPVEQSIEMTSITEITNINHQLEQVSRFYVSTIIQRVIAQMVAAYEDGFVTLQASADGYLKVLLAGITQTPFYVEIDFAGAGDTTIKAGVAGQKIRITGLTFTVGGETNITLKDGAVDISGPMDFGGANEPRGMVSNHGNVPLELSTAQAFVVNSSLAVQVSGFVTGYIE